MIEKLMPLYQRPDFEKSAIPIQRESVYRIDVAGLRHYFRPKDKRVYKSLTTFISSVLPKSKFLENWREKMTADLGGTGEMATWMKNVADYGTGLHIAIAEYCKDGVDWQAFDTWVFEYLSKGMGLTGETLLSAKDEFIKDFAGLLQFFVDYRVDVLAVEIPVFMEAGVATLIDLVVEMDAKNYEKTPPEKRKRITAIGNLKSGKKGFFDEHVLQLVGERRAFNETYGEQTGIVIEHVFNLAPSDWKTEPGYKMKFQTDEIVKGEKEAVFDALLKLAEVGGHLGIPQKRFPIFFGRTEFGETPKNALKMMDYIDFVLERIEVGEGPQENESW